MKYIFLYGIFWLYLNILIIKNYIMEKSFKLQMFGYTLNPNSIRKSIRIDLAQNLGIQSINGEKGNHGELIIFPTKEQTMEQIISYLKPIHNGHFPGIGNYGFQLMENML